MMYGIYPKTLVIEKHISGECDEKNFSGEHRYSLEGKSILKQSIRSLEKDLLAGSRTLVQVDHEINFIIELIKQRENLVNNKYSGTDLQDEMLNYLKKLDLLVYNFSLNYSTRIREENSYHMVNSTSLADLYLESQTMFEQLKINNMSQEETGTSSIESDELQHLYLNFERTKQTFNKFEDCQLSIFIYDIQKEKMFNEPECFTITAKESTNADITRHQMLVENVNEIKNEENAYLICSVTAKGILSSKQKNYILSSSKQSKDSKSKEQKNGKEKSMRYIVAVSITRLQDLLRNLSRANTNKLTIEETFIQADNEPMDTFLKRAEVMQRMTGESAVKSSTVRVLSGVLPGTESIQPASKLHFEATLYSGELKKVLDNIRSEVSSSSRSKLVNMLSQVLKYPKIIGMDYLRNDIYVTLMDASTVRAGKYSEKNIVIRACVVDPEFKIINGAIRYGANSEPSDFYESTSLYHENKPRYLETFKIVIAGSQMINSHVRFEIYHLSNSNDKFHGAPYGIAYFSLNNRSSRTVVSTGQKNLMIHRPEPKADIKSIVSNCVYFGQPITIEEAAGGNITRQNFFITQKKGSFEYLKINFQCFTAKLSSDNNLVSILTANPGPMAIKNAEFNTLSINKALESYFHMRTEDSEIKKFNNPLVECFLNLLDEGRRMREASKDGGRLSENVFKCLIRTYNLMYSQSTQRELTVEQELDGDSELDRYLIQQETTFRIQCYKEILNCIELFLTKRLGAQNSSNSRNENSGELEFDHFITALPFLIRICKIGRALCQKRGQNDPNDTQAIKKAIRVLLKFEDYMSVLKQEDKLRSYFVSIILLLEIITDGDFNIESELNSLKIILTQRKLVMSPKLKNRVVEMITASIFFQTQQYRKVLLDDLLRIIFESSSGSVSTNPKFQLALNNTPHSQHCYRLVSSIISTILYDDVEDKSGELDIFSHRFLSSTMLYLGSEVSTTADSAGESADIDNKFVKFEAEQLQNRMHAGMSFLTFFTLLDAHSVDKMFSDMKTKKTRKLQLYHILKSLRSILKLVQLKSNVHGFNLSIEFQGEVVQSAIHLLALMKGPIVVYFFDPVEIGIFNQYLDCCVELLMNRSLRFDQQNEYERMTVVGLFGDLRTDIFDVFVDIFPQFADRFGNIPEMLYTIQYLIKSGLLCKSRERRIVVKYLLDILDKNKNNYSQFEKAKQLVLDNVHIAFSNDLGNENICSSLMSIIRLMKVNYDMDIDEFLDDLQKLTYILLEHREALSQTEISMALSFDKMYDIFRQGNNPEKTLMVLKQMHNLLSASYKTEKGFILEEYLTMMSDAPETTNFEETKLPFMSWPSEINQLCLEVAEKARESYFNAGLYKNAIRVSMRSITNADKIGDYKKLALIHSNLHDYYQKLHRGVSASPNYTYFKVEYFGSTMPKVLRDQMCIFRGEHNTQPGELMTYFTNMINVTNFVLDERKLEEKKKSIGSSSSLILIQQVTSVLDNRPSDMDEILERIPTISNDCLFYYDILSFIGGIKSVSHQTIKRKYLRALKPLPGMSKVTRGWVIYTAEKGPIQLAVPSIEMGTDALAVDIKTAEKTGNADTVYMRLAGIVNPGVNGGIANYKVFFTPEIKTNPDFTNQLPYLDSVKDVIVKQCQVVREGLEKCVELGKDVSSIVKHFVTHQKMLENEFHIPAKKIEDVCGKFFGDKCLKNFVKHSDEMFGTFRSRGGAYTG